MKKILLVQPQNSRFADISLWLNRNGFNTQIIHEWDNQAHPHLNHVDLILMDASSLAEQTPSLHEHTAFTIIMDAEASIERSVTMMTIGASNYIPLPTSESKLIASIIQTFETRKQATKNQPDYPIKQERLIDKLAANGVIGQCQPMMELYSDIDKISDTDVTVLIRGESGTGKELIAKALHNFSKRHDKPLISVNCAAIPENLIESELFGHEKGAFTGAVSARDGLISAANDGTLFLDEIGELPLEAQARLLRVLQEGEIRRVGSVNSTKVNIRLVTATHRNLKAMIQQGLFREDLYYRLYVMELILPPLRERGDDISHIAETLLYKCCEKHHKPKLNYTSEFDQAIRQHDWPGNVRELENAIERATILSNSKQIDPKKLKIPSEKTHFHKSLATPELLEVNRYDNPPMSLDDHLKHVVLKNQNRMTESQLALLLGISRKSLWERRQKLGIPRKVTNNK